MGSESLIAVLDANVLYPFFQRDLLLSLGYEELYIPKWSDEIEQEWVRNLKKDRPDIADKLGRTIELMNQAFPDAKVTGYENRIKTVSLPDKNDRHVLAAAIECKANMIVTYNRSDFPDKELSPFGIRAVEPDSFVMELIDRDITTVWKAINEMAEIRTNPPVSIEDLVNQIAERGMNKSAALLNKYLKK
ncbi:MAG: PIN domain-containing protein [Bacteroidetes bacterium]|jgi:predicted nucleic acid-binding protein|nr:PIN domain-containing protein [Bacteroidota bacterium]